MGVDDDETIECNPIGAEIFEDPNDNKKFYSSMSLKSMVVSVGN